MVALAPGVFETQLFRYSRLMLAVCAAAMPLYVVRYQVGPVPTTLLEDLVLLTIGLYVAACIRTGAWRALRTPLEIPIALLLIAGMIAIVISPDHRGALGLYRAYFVEPVLLFYVAIDLMRTRDEFRVVLTGLAIGTTIFALINLGAWVMAIALHQKIDIYNAPEALYTSPNAVAMFLEPPLAIAVGFALYADRPRDRKVALICLLFLLAAMVFTLSRGGLLTLTVLALVAVATIPRRRLKVALLVGALIGGIAVSRIPWVAGRLANQLDPNYRGNTFEGRLTIWNDTLHMLRDHPIFGAGLRGYTQVMVPYVTGGHGPELYPHDIWLSVWSELGLLGLAAFAALILLLLWRGWRAFAQATGFERPLLWGTSAAFVAIAVHGFFDTPYFKNDFAIEFWIVAALEIAALNAIATRGSGTQRIPSLFAAPSGTGSAPSGTAGGVERIAR